MNKLLEILGRAITVDTADLIWHWLNAVQRKPQGQGDTADELDEVVELLANMQLQEVQNKLKFYLYENPECPFGRMAAVALCLRANDISAAMEQLQSIYMRQPSNTLALYVLGYCYERMGRTPEAVEFYQDSLKFKSHLQLPRQRLAAIYLHAGRIDKTILEYELLTTEHPEDIGSMVLLGYLYLAASQYEQAIDTFNTAILAHPDNFHDDNHEDEVEEWVQSGAFEQAIEHIQGLIDQVGQMPDLDVRMADILSKAGRLPEAVSHYENALRNQPNYLEATIKLGTHYLRFGRQELAAAQFNRAMEINDEIVDAYVGLAMSQQLAGDEDEAYTTLSLASAIQQNSTLLFSQTAMLHLETTLKEESDHCRVPRQPEELMQEIIKAHEVQINQTPKSPDAHYKLGLLMMIVGDMEAAIRAFTNALHINPTHHRVRCKLALCLFEAGQKKPSLQTLTEQTTLEPELLDLHYRTALLYCDRHRFAEALCNLENLMKNNFTEPDAVINIEVVLENLGLIDRTHTTWDRLTEAARNALSLNAQD